MRRLTRKFEGVQSIKAERPETPLSTIIAERMRREASYRKKVLMRMTIETKRAGMEPFGEMDVERIIDLQESIQAMIEDTPALRRSMKVYPIANAIHDYVKARKILDRMNLPPTYQLIVSMMLVPHFTGKEEALRKAIQEEPVQMDLFSPIVKKMHAFEPFEFFKQIQGDEKQMRRIPNQQLVLENELESALLMASKTHEHIQQADHEIHSPSQETIAQIRARVKGFDQRPREIKERIIQEHIAARLGRTLAQNIESLARTRMNMSGSRKEMFEWIIRSLKHKENTQFLARKALEWYRTRLT